MSKIKVESIAIFIISRRHTMTTWTKIALICAAALISAQSYGREETWELVVWPAPWVVEYKSTWKLNISDSGAVTGVANWETTEEGAGKVIKFEGQISKDGEISLTRHVAGDHPGKTQKYTGKYEGGGLASTGDTSGFGGPGSRVADVNVNKNKININEHYS